MNIEDRSRTTAEHAERGVFVLQINLTDITKRPLQITARLDTYNEPFVLSNLKLIGEELWHCHDDGISVYDCQRSKLREIRFGRRTMSVAALDTKTVVIAILNSGLMITSTSGTCINVRVVNVGIFCKMHILKIWHPTLF